MPVRATSQQTHAPACTQQTNRVASVSAINVSCGVPAMTAPSSRKLKILCFHGYLQNGKEFAGKLGSLRKALKSRAEFVFVDAPHLVRAEDDQPDSSGSEPRTWWTWEDPEVHARPSLASQYVGADTSLQVAEHALQEHKPVDGILGFSQGAALSSLLLAHVQQTNNLQPLKFAILAGAFLPKDPKYADVLSACLIKTPTLFICGEQDQLIPLERTQQLTRLFDPNSIQQYQHNGGHMVPTCTGDFKQVLQDFLDKLEAG